MAGRRISAANEAKLRAALESIGAVLEGLGAADDDGDQDKDKEPAATDAKPAAESAGDPVALAGDFMPLVESAVRSDGTALLKIIAPGWGSSGFYSPDVLRRDGPKVFRAGLKGYWDRPTAAEEAERPEGSLTRLASELATDARWMEAGPAGPGLYADTRVFGPYRAAVNELAPSIGVSIRAAGRTAQGSAEGRKGPLVEELVKAHSVDWVTQPGAGGKIVQMFEAARPGAAGPDDQDKQGEQGDQDMDTLEALRAELATVIADRDRALEGLLLREARDLVAADLPADLPEVTRARLLERIAANPPIAAGQLDKTALAETVKTAVTAERDYLSQAAGIGSGAVRGMGGGASAAGGGAAPATDTAARMTEAFKQLGLSDAEAAIAAKGR